MEEYFTVYNRTLYLNNNRIKITKLKRGEDKIKKFKKLEKLQEIDIDETIKSIVSPSRNFYHKYKKITDQMINFSMVNFCFSIITSRPIYNNPQVNIYSEDNEFINKKIEQGVDIKYVDEISEADIVLFNKGDFKEGANLLLYVNISKKLQELVEMSKDFNHVSVYSHERTLDDNDNKVYIYFENYYKDQNKSLYIESFFIKMHNLHLSNRIDFYTKCIKVITEKNYNVRENQVNFISCEKILNIF